MLLDGVRENTIWMWLIFWHLDYWTFRKWLVGLDMLSLPRLEVICWQIEATPLTIFPPIIYILHRYRVTSIVWLPPRLTNFILNYFLSNFLSNSPFPPIPAGRLEQLKSSCIDNTFFLCFDVQNLWPFVNPPFRIEQKEQENLKFSISPDRKNSEMFLQYFRGLICLRHMKKVVLFNIVIFIIFFCLRSMMGSEEI